MSFCNFPAGTRSTSSRQLLMARPFVLFCVALAALASSYEVSATHPVVQQAARTESQDTERQRFLSHSQRLQTACNKSKVGRELQEQNAVRRAAKLRELRASRRLDVTTVLATSHKTNLTDVTTATYPKYLFGDDDSVKCVLAPETTQNSFYVSGEVYRQDITEDQAGISLSTELQFIDVNTCTPVADLWIDFWHSNALGVYSGVAGSEAGESTEASNVDSTFLRGLVQTDSYGLVGFTSIFPGHYAGRAPHIDIAATYSGTLQSNSTYTGGSVVHAGEIFFDQDLITEVEGASPYASNVQNLTLNEDDAGLAEAAATGYDPIVEYTLIGDSVEDGVFAWVSIGVDLAASNNVTAAGAFTSNGGVQYRKL